MRPSILLSVVASVAFSLALLPNTAAAQDSDGDGFPAGIDCDDTNNQVYPGAPEICDDGINQDCINNSCVTDAETGIEDCAGGDQLSDVDGDGYQNTTCGGDDCNDRSAVLNHDDADGDGFTSCAGDCDDEDVGVDPVDDDGDGFHDCQGDCDDTTAAIGPLVDEVCGDELDNDCDGTPDNIDVDGDGTFPAECGGDDCDDSDASLTPAVAESGAVCNDSVDNDCDGLSDASDPDCYEAPEIDAGRDQQDRYLGGTIVIVLDGSATTDFNADDTLTYTWTVAAVEDYSEATWTVEADSASPFGFLRFHATPSDRTEFVFDATLVVSDGVPETDDDEATIEVRIWRPAIVPPSNCATLPGGRPSGLAALGLALGLVGLRRRRA